VLVALGFSLRTKSIFYKQLEEIGNKGGLVWVLCGVILKIAVVIFIIKGCMGQ